MNKWKQLNKLYLDAQALGTMCARLLFYKEKGGKHRYYIPDIGMQFKERRNASGSCLLSMTVGYNQTDGWHVEIFTRASELTMRWYCDLIFIHVLIREIGKIVGFTPKECKVYWRMASTYQSITSIPLFLIMDGGEQWIKDKIDEGCLERGKLPDWQYYTLRRYMKVYQGDGYQSFKVQKRAADAYRMLTGEIASREVLNTQDLTLPDIDINQNIDFAEEEDLFNVKGYV
jgi:hypothetical protein